MFNWRKRTGDEGESLATRFLRRAGYRILAGNYRCRYGEIDLVVEEPKTGAICFVEVRSRRTETYGTSAASVTWRKQRRIARAAKCFLVERKLSDAPARFDVVAIQMGDTTEIQHIRNAFTLSDALPRRYW